MRLHLHRTHYAVFAFSFALMSIQLAGCHECRESESPCGSKGKFLVCGDLHLPERRWHEHECPGVEPICVDLPDKQHRCDEARPLPRCSTLRTLTTPLLVSPHGLFAVADLDGNGRLDLVLSALTGSAPAIVRVMQGSDGRFGVPVEIFHETRHNSVFAADLDGDGRLDLLDSTGSTHTGHFGQADGSFSEPVAGSPLVQGLLAVSDVDADGSAELIARVQDLLVLLGPPPSFPRRATLRVPLPPRRGGFPSTITGAKARDLDGDERLELIVITSNGELDVFSQAFTRADDGWSTDTRPWAPDPQLTFEYIADFDHDGIPDRVSWDDGQAVHPRVFVAIGDGAGKFAKHEAKKLPEYGVLQLADFDGDANLDIVSVGESITFLRGRGDGSLEKPRSFALPGIDTHAMSVLMTDFDGDAAPDLIGVDFAKVFVASRACIEPN